MSTGHQYFLAGKARPTWTHINPPSYPQFLASIYPTLQKRDSGEHSGKMGTVLLTSGLLAIVRQFILKGGENQEKFSKKGLAGTEAIDRKYLWLAMLDLRFGLWEKSKKGKFYRLFRKAIIATKNIFYT